MSSASTANQREESGLRVVLRSPLYRGATAALFLSGLASSAATPQMALFLVKTLGASLTTAGLFYLTSLTAPVAGYLIGRRSDRTGRRLGLFRVCAGAGFVSWTVISYAHDVWVPFVVSALLLGFAGAAGSQVFAAVHDELQAQRVQGGEGVIAIVRMATTAGWVVGPSAGALLAATIGLRSVFFATAVCTIAQVLPLRSGTRARTAPTPSPPEQLAQPPAHRPPLRAMAPLFAFTGLFVLVYAGEPIRYAYLPLYMNEDLHSAPGTVGAVIGLQPLVELLLMPLSIIVARRVGMMRLMVLGAAFGVGAYTCFAFSATVVGMFAGQALMGGVWGIFAALGIIVAQRLLPHAIATGSAIFLGSTAVANAIGGLTGALGVTILGLPHVFVAPAVLGVLAAIGLAIMSGWYERHQGASRPEYAPTDVDGTFAP
jgi:SET family sugar efflux transporter-like MFS transporter